MLLHDFSDHFIIAGLAAEMGGPKVADLGVKIWLRHHDAAAFDAIMDEVDVQPRVVVDVIERVGHVRGNLHPRYPRLQHCVVRVPLVPQAIGEAGAFHELVHQVNVLAGDRRAEELHYAR